MKKISLALSFMFLLVSMFGSLVLPQTALAASTPVIAEDSTVVSNGAPAGMKTVVKDTSDGFISVSLVLRGTIGINSFSWALGYDKTKVIPVTYSGKVDMPSTLLATSSDISPYYNVSDPGKIVGWSPSSYVMENTQGALTGNYVLIGYAKNAGSTLILADGVESTLIKMIFKKKSTPSTNTFFYSYSTAGVTVVTKLIYKTTNILTNGTSGSNTFVRPDLFSFEFIGITDTTATPTLSPSPTPTPSPTITPTATPTIDPSASPTATPSPTPTPTLHPTYPPTPTPTSKPPIAPVINTITNTVKTISGKAVSLGEVRVVAGSRLYICTSLSGTWKIAMTSTLVAGTKVTAYVKFNNRNSTVTTTYVIPATPIVKHVEPNSVSVKGTATKSSTVYAKIGTKTYYSTANSKTGAFAIKVPKVKKNTLISVRCKAGGRYSAYNVVKAT